MSRHLLIAGTGRAGTSFLVRYLHLQGLDTHLSRNGPNAAWDSAAQAGLEDLPHPRATDLPYVIKSPWTFQVIHDALTSGRLTLDAAIIPLRDLTEAACSRSIIEMQAVRRQLSWLGELDRTWDVYGHTSGGAVYSLNPLDQARLLAVGLHRLLEALVRAEVPVILLSFPRLIHDAAYLHRTLAPVLPTQISAEAARDAHAAVADPAKVRVGDEIGASDPSSRHGSLSLESFPQESLSLGLVQEGPGPQRLEQATLARTLSEIRGELDSTRAQLADARAFAAATVAARTADAEVLQGLRDALARMTEARDSALERVRLTEAAFQAQQHASLAEARVNEMELAELRRQVMELSRGWRDRWRHGRARRGVGQAAE